jgi:glucose-6-phosphate 1-dehydrogenase
MAPDRILVDPDIDAGQPHVPVPRATIARRPAGERLSASAHLLLDALAGDRDRVLLPAEIDESWRVVDAIRRGWAAGAAPLTEYPAGSIGPG